MILLHKFPIEIDALTSRITDNCLEDCVVNEEKHKIHFALITCACASNLEQVLAATPNKTPTVRPPASYNENYSS